MRRYSVPSIDPINCQSEGCHSPLRVWRWEVVIGGERKVACTERCAKDIQHLLELDHQLHLPLKIPIQPGDLPQLEG